MTVIGALSCFRELGEMSPHKRAQVHRFTLTGCRHAAELVSQAQGFHFAPYDATTVR
jgi:hypothetical protein